MSFSFRKGKMNVTGKRLVSLLCLLVLTAGILCLPGRTLAAGKPIEESQTNPQAAAPSYRTETYSGQTDPNVVISGYAIKRIATRTGPGNTYPSGGNYNRLTNTWLSVRQRAWDRRNGIWWVEALVEGRWLWTPYERFDSNTLPLYDLPLYGVAVQPDMSNVLWGYVVTRISCRKGPGSQYDGGGTFNTLKNVWMPIRSRAWDATNKIWWVEVLVGPDWLWTNYSRFDSATLPLESIPLQGKNPATESMFLQTIAPMPAPVTVPPITVPPITVPPVTVPPTTPEPVYDQYHYTQTVYGYAIDSLSTRNGPGTQYDGRGTYSSLKNTWVEVRSRAWDTRNGIWWVEVHIGNDWLWTGYKRFDSETIPLQSIPINPFY